jgi:uncharacterized protein YkuJ
MQAFLDKRLNLLLEDSGTETTSNKRKQPPSLSPVAIDDSDDETVIELTKVKAKEIFPDDKIDDDSLLNGMSQVSVDVLPSDVSNRKPAPKGK